jgi:hypothetical protein
MGPVTNWSIKTPAKTENATVNSALRGQMPRSRA